MLEKRQLAESSTEQAGNTFNDLLLVGFLGTIAHTLPNKIFGEVWLVLTFPNIEISLATLIWCIAINVYLSILWFIVYRITNDLFCQYVSYCYLFAIIEMFVVWDKPWFRFMGIPMTSNTLIFFGFLFSYANKRWRLTT